MKKYSVCVNGEKYEIEIELLGEVPAAASAAPAAPAAPAGAGERLAAPMPGTVLAVNVKDGDRVRKGQALFVLEAMKMENEIPAPADGVVSAISVKKGDTVETDALLCMIG